MKKFAVAFILFACVLLAACDSPAPTGAATTMPPPSPSDGGGDPPVTASPSPDSSVFDFAGLSDVLFVFSSGAGAWSTEVTIAADGTFSGYFSDSNMGDTDTDYPNGTVYYCSFSGKFSAPEKIGEHEYSMICESITQEGTPDEAEIGDDGCRYITGFPYGFDNAGEFRLYLPGKNVSELPEEFINWMPMRNELEEVFPYYGLYNVAGAQGFCGQ